MNFPLLRWDGNGDFGGMNWESGCRAHAPNGSNRTLTVCVPPSSFEALRRICGTCGMCRIQRKHSRAIHGTIGA